MKRAIAAQESNWILTPTPNKPATAPGGRTRAPSFSPAKGEGVLGLSERILHPWLVLPALIPLCLLLSTLTVRAAEEIEITEYAQGVRLIPISLSGYTGETLSVLKFDLEVVGFQIVEGEKAQYSLSGSNAGGNVEGRLVDRVTKNNLLANRYSGASLRTQAHSLADDVVSKITGMPGIARTRIAFRGDVGRRKEVYVADYDGANPAAITQDDALVAAPSWVPGKAALYYTSYLSGYPDIYFHDLTGARRVIAKYSGLNTSPAAARGGQRVAMILSKGGSPDLYVSNWDGTGLIQLTKTREVESDPCWSPDGRTICFASRISGQPNLYLLPAEGGTMRRLRTTGSGIVTEPDWSPDGKQIAFTTQRGSNFEICVVPAQGGEVVTLAAGEDPSWAPNSRTLIFTQRKGNRHGLSLLDVPTKRVKTLPINLGNCLQPNWAK